MCQRDLLGLTLGCEYKQCVIMRNKSIKLESLTFIVVMHLKVDDVDLSWSMQKQLKFEVINNILNNTLI